MSFWYYSGAGSLDRVGFAISSDDDDRVTIKALLGIDDVIRAIILTSFFVNLVTLKSSNSLP